MELFISSWNEARVFSAGMQCTFSNCGASNDSLTSSFDSYALHPLFQIHKANCFHPRSSLIHRIIANYDIPMIHNRNFIVIDLELNSNTRHNTCRMVVEITVLIIVTALQQYYVPLSCRRQQKSLTFSVTVFKGEFLQGFIALSCFYNLYFLKNYYLTIRVSASPCGSCYSPCFQARGSQGQGITLRPSSLA